MKTKQPGITIHKPDLLLIATELTLIKLKASKVMRQLEESITAVDELVCRTRAAHNEVMKTIEACESRKPDPR